MLRFPNVAVNLFALNLSVSNSYKVLCHVKQIRRTIVMAFMAHLQGFNLPRRLLPGFPPAVFGYCKAATLLTLANITNIFAH